MQDESKIYKALMALTEAEAATMDFLERIDNLRDALRDVIDRGEAE